MSTYWSETTALPPVRPDDGLEDADVVVVGAGIAGLVTAVELARAGRKVLVLEARRLGAVTTGHTTGKISLLQGTKLSRMLDRTSARVAGSYVEANRIGRSWLLDFCTEQDVPFQTHDAATFAATPDERSAAEAEHRAATKLGLPTRWVESPDLGVPAFGATVLADQAQLDPLPLLIALARDLVALGGELREESRVVAVSKVGRPAVRTEDGREVRCDDVVLATGTPVLDRGLYFAKVEANRSYVLMFSGATPPEHLLLSAGSPHLSLRPVPSPGGPDLLMVGGNGHVVGRTVSERRHVDELRIWAAERFPDAVETHAWSAQDYSSHDGIPFVGKLPRGLGRIHLATGFDKWGLTNGVAAGLRISGEILGSAPSWARPMARRVTRPRGALAMVATNVGVGAALARRAVAAELRAAVAAPEEGQGVVGRSGLDPTPVATSTVDGRTCAVTGLCTHLGGVLKWNDQERSWDCPLHGSRFAPDGAVLEGPATRPLHVRRADVSGTGERVRTDHDAST